MKLLCIDDSSIWHKVHPFLKYGEIYYSIGEMRNQQDAWCYIIPSLPVTLMPDFSSNGMPLYLKARFINLDEPVIHEVINTKEEVYA